MRYRRHRIIAGAAIVSGLGALSLATPALAQRVPEGSYGDTCRHITMRGPVLRALCRPIHEGWTVTRIFAPRCGDAGISNHDGILSCGMH